LAQQVATLMEEHGCEFIVAFQPSCDHGQNPQAVWAGRSNVSGYATLVAGLLDGVLQGETPGDCPGCNLALEHLRLAQFAITPDGDQPSHVH
jgi:hypothetical protein